MKINKFNEENINPLEQELELRIYTIMSYEIEMRQVKYSDDYEISDESMEIAAKKIVEYLKSRGLMYALDAEKYNL